MNRKKERSEKGPGPDFELIWRNWGLLFFQRVIRALSRNKLMERSGGPLKIKKKWTPEFGIGSGLGRLENLGQRKKKDILGKR